jgi:hypothetical protein
MGKPITPQEFFDKIVRHLLKQGKKALHERTRKISTVCAYLAADGCRCAAGCHIPRRDYRKAMEGKNVIALLIENPKLKPRFPDLFLATELQQVHDLNEPETWRDKLLAVGKHHGLSTACLNETVDG